MYYSLLNNWYILSAIRSFKQWIIKGRFCVDLRDWRVDRDRYFLISEHVVLIRLGGHLAVLGFVKINSCPKDIL